MFFNIFDLTNKKEFSFEIIKSFCHLESLCINTRQSGLLCQYSVRCGHVCDILRVLSDSLTL